MKRTRPTGKSTQAQRVATQLGFRHVSSGDLLRRCKDGDTPLGRYVRENWYQDPSLLTALQRLLNHSSVFKASAYSLRHCVGIGDAGGSR